MVEKHLKISQRSCFKMCSFGEILEAQLGWDIRQTRSSETRQWKPQRPKTQLTEEESYKQLCELSKTTTSDLVMEFDSHFLGGGKKLIEVSLAKAISQHLLKFSNDVVQRKVDRVTRLNTWNSVEDVKAFLSVLEDFFHSPPDEFLKSISLQGKDIFPQVRQYKWSN